MKRKLNGPLALGLLLALGFLALMLYARFGFHPASRPAPVSDEEILKAILHKDKALAPGVDGHLLGTTKLGGDVFEMLVMGARPTLSLGVVIMFGRALLAVPLGLLAGWYGRGLGRIVGAFSAVFTAVPTMIFAIVAMNALNAMLIRGTGQQSTLLQIAGPLVLILAGFPRLTQQIRLLTEGIKTQPYLESAMAAGASTGRILFRHILPAMYSDLLVTMAAETAWVLMLCAQMAVFEQFIAANWATQFGSGLWDLRTAPWVALYPGLALGLAVACFQLLSEGLRRLWVERV